MPAQGRSQKILKIGVLEFLGGIRIFFLKNQSKLMKFSKNIEVSTKKNVPLATPLNPFVPSYSYL